MNIKAILVTLLVVGGFSTAAEAKARLTCTPGMLGCPVVKPATAGTTPATPVSSGDPLKDVLTEIMNGKATIIDHLNQALTTQAAVINPVTGAAWDPYSSMCISGVPAQGTQGQPGYIPTALGLIGWINSLVAPAVSSVPPLPDNPSPATLAVHARLLLMAANSDIGNVLTQVNTTGIPRDLKISCGPLINDTQVQAQTMVNQGTVLAGMLAALIH